jgi:hypothetical protein
MALSTPEDHIDQAEQLTLLSPEELTELRRCSVSSQPPAMRTASSEVRGVRKPRRPKDSAVQDELPFP